MERKLKFRVWNKSTKNWLNSQVGTHCFSEYYLDIEGGGLVSFDGSISAEFESYTKGPKNDYYLDGTKIVKESPYVITQFTGLKDKNNKEIYEGDIVKHWIDIGPGDKIQLVSPVMISEWGPNLESWTYKENCLPEIVGNIFQNKELLKEN